ncbi:MAG: hypothetical protein FJ126_06735 [Deltaproteobacteria bacterium]|nr:hypothetical protein [Deltaproteobacteria bacterium]
MAPEMPQVIKLGRLSPIFLVISLLLMLPGCPAAPPADENLRREMESLKKEVAAFKDQVYKLEATQKLLLAQLTTEPPASAPATAAAPTPSPASPEASGAPASSEPLSVSKLIKEKDRYLGFRVTVKGPVGPVLVHHKSLMLKAPEGMVEVLLGKLPDQQMVEKLLALPVIGPLTVTGVAKMSPRGGTQMQIQAEVLEF